ncbi:hypothetical protein NLJ89_g5598 [Agrocybe chaxingu]|uniref:Deacetylase sirtuin-type domain-containing protein n=1 Tax=Agrocybe chaxingu TaxID=84603 RepID=A0A9W8K0Q1_9AGAR|nr:hypothetical protein NLJ89_g5598 [Agrocybe chaxingu]
MSNPNPDPTPPLNSESIVHESKHADPVGDFHARTFSADNKILIFQVKVFLTAAEDVETDPETINDILEVLDVDQSGDESDNPHPEMQMDEDSQEENSSHSEDEDDAHEFPSRSDSNTPLKTQDQETWSKEEIKEMMHLLKEYGETAFMQEYVRTRNVPIVKLLQAFGIDLCPELRNRRPRTMLYFLRVVIAHTLRKREKLFEYNTIEDAVELIRKSQRILILTGAGISVSCGIPDFRSRDGLYASLKNKGEYDLDDPQQMFDIQYFRENPSVFYQIYPANFVPSPCHRFIKLVEDQGKNYTQNIDTLETLAGVQKVLQCHGSFATASCLQCRRRVAGAEIEAEIMGQRVPLCTVCNDAPATASVKPKKMSKKKAKGEWDSDEEDESDVPEYPPGIMKPDITFFGEKLNDDFDRSLAEDRWKVDLLLVIGTSLKVSPVAEILSHLPHSVPQILINKTAIRHINPDIVLLGNADDIVLHLCNELGWELPPPTPARAEAAPSASSSSGVNGVGRLQPPRVSNLKKRASASSQDSELRLPLPPRRVGDSHVYLFDGADGGKWLQQLRKKLGIASAPPSAPGSGYNTRSSTPALSPAKIAEANGRREAKKPRIA